MFCLFVVICWLCVVVLSFAVLVCSLSCVVLCLFGFCWWLVVWVCLFAVGCLSVRVVWYVLFTTCCLSFVVRCSRSLVRLLPLCVMFGCVLVSSLFCCCV